MSVSQPAVPGSAEAAEERYAKLSVAAAVFFLMLEVGYLAVSLAPVMLVPPRDFDGYAFGRDFVNVWMGGRAALAGGPAAWFDFAAYNDALRAVFGTDFPPHYWSYPPHLLLFTWPFGLLPYLPAYVLWCLVGIALYLVVAANGDLRRDRLLFLGAAPGVAICVFFGQNGLFTAALLIAGLTNLERRPMLSGVMFGILTIKPQLGLLLPLMLIVTGRWRTIAAAIVTAGVLIATTSALYGPGIWGAYLDKVTPQQNWLLLNASGLLLAMVASPFEAARMIGSPASLAWVAQGLATTAAVAAVAWTFWRRRDPMLSIALLVTATFLATPWALTYDLVILGWVVDRLRHRADNDVNDHRLLIAVWSLPVTMILAGAVHIPLAFAVLALFAGRLLWRLSRQQDVSLVEDVGRTSRRMLSGPASADGEAKRPLPLADS